VAALPRIVTQHDLQITPIGGNNPANLAPEGPNRLRMNMIAKTYRYLDEDEIAAEAERSKGKKGGRR
jgi:type IV pilus assembly protein PilO